MKQNDTAGASAPRQHADVPAAEVAQLLADLQRVGAKTTGEMIGICCQAGAVIQALQGRASTAGQASEGDALDAARYRWLRNTDWFKTGLVRTMCGGKSTFQFVGKRLDSEIDTQRSKA